MRTSAAAHKVNDIKTVSIMQFGVIPLCPRHDLAIQFHGYAVSLHPKLLDEFSQRD